MDGATDVEIARMMSPSSTGIGGRLALGTAQFGTPYGISNTRGLIPPAEALAILREALSDGIVTIDTAESYGDSEVIIGRANAGLPQVFEITTKFPAGVTAASLPGHLSASLERLQVGSLAGYLAHDPASLLDPGIVDALRSARDQSKIGRFGLSAYHPYEVEACLERKIDIGLVQLPFSAADGRFSALLPRLKERDIQVHARSVFLQGLLLMDPADVPQSLRAILPTIEALRAEAVDRQVPLNALLLGVALTEECIDRVVVGVTSAKELRMNVDAAGLADRCRLSPSQSRSFAISDESLILPFNWPR